MTRLAAQANNPARLDYVGAGQFVADLCGLDFTDSNKRDPNPVPTPKPPPPPQQPKGPGI